MKKTTSDFTTTVEVRYADTDANGHVFFGNYFTYFDIAFYKYIEFVGYPFQWFVDRGLNIYYVDAHSQFLSGLRYGDTIRIDVVLTKIGNSSMTVAFNGTNDKTGEAVASGEIVAVVVDIKKETAVSVPDAFKQAVSDLT